MLTLKRAPNKITGPNAGGPRQFPIRTPLAARVGQFWRSPKAVMRQCIKTISVLALFMFGALGRLSAGDLETTRTNLETQVGGTWQVQTHQRWTFLAPETLPKGLDKGTYVIFLSDTNRTALEQATSYAEMCQAPFFTLGTNSHLAVITYVPRSHPVSQAVVKTLRLEEPKDIPVRERLTMHTGRNIGEPDGAANGSQPIRSETNRTSSAAGSRR